MSETNKNNHLYQYLPEDVDRCGFFARKTTQSNNVMPSYHSHPHYEILYITSGAKKITVNNSITYTLDSNCIALLKPHVIHQVKSASPNTQQRILIHVSADLMNSITQFTSHELIDCFNSPVLKLSTYTIKMMNYFMAALIDLSPEAPDYLIQGKVLLSNLFLLLTTEFKDQNISEFISTSKSEQDYSKLIAEYIANNFHKTITVSDLAKMLHFSKTHVSRIFKNVMNTTLHKYLVSVRIVNAKEMLLEDNSSIYSVSFKCGFNSPEAFSRAFRHHMGCSPSEYIKKQKELAE